MASSRAASFSKSLLYRWDPIFDLPRDLSHQHDTPYVDVRNDVDVAFDLTECFAQALDETDSCHPATDTLTGFCTDVNLRTLQQNLCSTTRLVAILEDRGGLTAWGLYQALAKAKAEEPKGRRSETRERLLYVTNLNCWTVFTLAACAPTHEACVLAEFILNHLRFDPLVNVKFPLISLPVFALEFHFPNFAFRRHRLPRADSQRTVNGKGLRQYQDISFLRTMGSKPDNSPTEYIYEASISCLVFGLDSYSWAAYLFNDTYFESDDCSENIQEYHTQEHEGLMPDPLIAGKRPRCTRPSCPRERYLIIFETQIRRAKGEYQQLFDFVDEAIQLYICEYWAQARQLSSRRKDDENTCSTADRQRRILRDKLLEWIRRSDELLRKIITSLEKYTAERRRFRDTGINSFTSSDTNHSTRFYRSLTAIDKHFVDLERLSTKVQNVQNGLCDTIRHIDLQISHESNESTLFQQKTSRVVEIISLITFHSLPLTLISGLLSTQKGFIPITPSPWAFVTLIIILQMFAWFIVGSVLRRNWFIGKLKWARHYLWISNREIEGIELQQPEGLG
ncbi:hypothetical protein F4776DRAFT_312978 [Hypoxylon sp. NC0597]|nr:hypothetical protein F4776DRAFT_312978 [Hypoxylon sp. NC0597]